MINVMVTESSKKALYAEMDKKVEGMKELTTVRTRHEIMSAAFSMSAIKFVKTTNVMARSIKKSFHHVYEWNAVGTESGRLFRIIKRQEAGGAAQIYYKFNNSKKKSPIAQALTVPGPSGRVVTRSGIFKRKAEVMESGRSVNFVTTRYIAFSPKSGGIVFIPPGKSITIRNPGGEDTSGSFDKHFRSWWMINFQNTFNESAIPKRLEKNVARALNKKGAGRTSARDAISKTLRQYQVVGSVI